MLQVLEAPTKLLEAPTISAEEEIENTPWEGEILTNTPYSVSDGTALADGQPVAGYGQAVRLDPQAMREGTPYPFEMSGCWFIAMKRPEGHIDFFFVR